MSKYRCTGIVLAMALLIAGGCSDSGTKPRQPQLTFLQSACHRETDLHSGALAGEPGPRPFALLSWQSQCLDNGLGKAAVATSTEGVVRFVAGHDTLFVYHDSASYNCCSRIRFDLDIQDFSVVNFIEIDTATWHCDCMCHFNLASSVIGLSRGTYTARLWTENRDSLLGEAEVFVPGVEPIWFETSCDTLTVHHDAKIANCCSKFIFVFTQQGNLLAFTEIDTSSVPCRCTCNFDLTAQVSGLTGGQYGVQVWAADSLLDSGAVQITPCLGR